MSTPSSTTSNGQISHNVNDSPRRPSAASRPESVVFMIPGFPADEHDSTCLPAIQNYVAALAAARPDLAVHVIAFQYPYRRDTYAWNGATIHALGGCNRRRWHRIPTWARAVSTFARLRRRTDVKVLHTFWLTECTGVGRLLSRAFGVRHVASIGGQDATSSNRYLRRLRLGETTVTAGSSFAANRFAKATGLAPARVIPLGLDAARLETIAPPQRRDIDVIGVGSLIPLKRFDVFIEVIERLAEEVPDLTACIVGDGPQRGALAAEIERRGLADTLALTGELPRDDAFRRMLRSKVLLHPSAYESQGYVFLEGRFAGLDVVCRDVGHPGNGGRVHLCGSPAEMAEACRQALRAPASRSPASVPTVADTVRAFASIYRV